MEPAPNHDRYELEGAPQSVVDRIVNGEYAWLVNVPPARLEVGDYVRCTARDSDGGWEDVADRVVESIGRGNRMYRLAFTDGTWQNWMPQARVSRWTVADA